MQVIMKSKNIIKIPDFQTISNAHLKLFIAKFNDVFAYSNLREFAFVD